LFALLFVYILVGLVASMHASESLVVTNVCGVTMLERTENRRLNFFRSLFRECFTGAKGIHVVIEGAVLADILTEWFISV